MHICLKAITLVIFYDPIIKLLQILAVKTFIVGSFVSTEFNPWDDPMGSHVAHWRSIKT
jgi:hypothetical protein